MEAEAASPPTSLTVCLSAVVRVPVEPMDSAVALALATVAAVTTPLGVEAAALVALALPRPVQETHPERAALEKETSTGLEAPCITVAGEAVAYDAPMSGG